MADIEDFWTVKQLAEHVGCKVSDITRDFDRVPGHVHLAGRWHVFDPDKARNFRPGLIEVPTEHLIYLTEKQLAALEEEGYEIRPYVPEPVEIQNPFEDI